MSSSETWLLALDQGGHASRAIVFDSTGQIITAAFRPITTVRPSTDRVEHDAHEVVCSLQEVVHEVTTSLGKHAARIKAAGLATQRSSIVCWDRLSGAPLSPVISWQDRRYAAWVETLRVREPEIRALTGLALSPHYGASKIRWCLDELQDVRAAHARGTLAAGPLASYLLNALLAEKPLCVDPANASRTQLWSPAQCDWSEELLQIFGVPRAVLPASVPSRYHYGEYVAGAHRISLNVCTGDQSAVPYAFGPLDDRTLYLNMGTGAFMQRVQRGADNPRLLHSVIWADADQVITVLEGTVNGAGSALDWLRTQIDVPADRIVSTLTRADVASIEPPLFLNTVSGLGSPFWVPGIPPRFIGAGDERARVISVVESIAFLIAVNIEQMLQPQLRCVIATGGLASCDYLCECVASLTNLRIERAAAPEATATGLAFLLGGVAECWTATPRVTFAPESDANLMRRYSAWRELLRSGLPQLNV